MICEECGKSYTVLATHVRLAHSISVREYKIKYNLPLSKALADESWVDKMKKIGNKQKETKKGMDILNKLKECGRRNAVCLSLGLKKTSTSKRKTWPKCSQEKVNAMGGQSYKRTTLAKLEKVKEEWSKGVPIKEMSVSDGTIYKWIREGLLTKRKRTLYHKSSNQDKVDIK